MKSEAGEKNRIALKLLGGLQAIDAARQPLPLTSKKAAALLAYLALQSKPQSREKLMALLWGDSGEVQARGSLRQALTALRRVLPDDVLDTDAQAIALRTVDVDAVAFEHALQRGDLQAAVDTYEGDLLDGFHARAEAFDDWLLFERERLRGRALTAMRSLLEARAAAGDVEAATAVAVRLLAIDPLQEAVHRQLIRLYAESGRRGSAVRQYRLCRELLERELGAAPSPETERLYRDLQTPPEAPAPRPAKPAIVKAEPVLPEPLELRQVTVVSLGSASGAIADGDTIAAAERVLASFGASITRRLADGLLATFGVPFARSRDAELAVRAAVAVCQLGDAVSIGIDCGQVMVESARGGTLVLGQPLGRAATLQGRAAAGQVLLSETVRRAVAGCAATEAAGGQAWRVLELRELAPGGDVPLIGRRTELRLLTGTLEVCAEGGGGHTIWLRGEAGIGKSRLLAESVARAESLGFRVVLGRWLDFGVGSPAGPFRQLLLGLMDLPSDAAAGDVALAVAELVQARGIAPERAVYLHELLDLPLSSEARSVADATDHEARRKSQHALLEQLVAAACERGPLLVAIEDVHWASEPAAAQVLAIIEAAVGCRAVVVLSSRPEVGPLGPAWRARRSRAPVTVVTLGPLGESDALALAAAWGLDSDAAREVVARAEGNPFFLEQLARAGEGSRDVVPGAVQSLVLARLDRLPETTRSAFRAACVLGQRVDPAALEALVPGARNELGRLAEAGLVHAQGDDDFLIAHALLRDAGYATTVEAERMRWHARAAAWYAGRDPVLEAEHLERAGDERAAAAFAAAARAELGAYRHELGMALAQRGLARARDARLRFDLLALIGEEQRALGQVDAARETLEAALAAAGDDSQRCRARLGLVDLSRLTESTEEAHALLDHAEHEARRAGRPEDESHAHYLRGCLLFPSLDLERCLAEHEEALALARRASSPAHEARALGGLGDAFYLRGQMTTALAHVERCLAICRSHGLGRIEVANLAMAAVLRLYHLESEEAYAGCLAAARRAQQVGNRRAELIAVSNALDVQLFRGGWPAATEEARRCLTIGQSTGSASFVRLGRTLLAFARIAAGDTEQLPELRVAEASVRATAPKFYGATAAGMLALSTSDAQERNEALAQGEALLAAGAMSHNHLFFRPLAMLAALRASDWDGVDTQADAMARYTAAEPLPWSEALKQWGRALAEYGRGRPAGLDEVHARLAPTGLGTLLRPLARAVAGEEPSRAFRWPQV